MQRSRATGYSPFFMVYGSEVVLPSDIAFGAPRIQNYDENEAESTRRTDIDSAEEHRLTAFIQHARYEQQLRRYHDRNVHERDFNVGDLVLRRIQSTTGAHKPSSGSRNLLLTNAGWHGRGQPMEYQAPTPLLYVEA